MGLVIDLAVNKMKYSLRTKLSLSYALVTLFIVVLISLFTNFLLEKQFKEYMIKQQNQKNNEIVNLITQQYKQDNKFNRNVIETIGLNALEQGMIIKVEDSSAKIVWDAKVYDNSACVQMISNVENNTNSCYPNFKGGYIENKYPVKKDFDEVGSILIGYYGPFNFTDNDLNFINAQNAILVAVGVFSLLFAMVLGAYMARRISRPISRVISTAQQISKGYFGDRIIEESNTKEIIQLTGTVNNLAETLEKQETLRKRMAADVAHELRTPLATLQGQMEALIDGIWKPNADRFKSCHEEIMRLNRMVGDLEKLARFENDNIVLTKTPFKIMELIQQIISNVDTESNNKSIEINLTGSDEDIVADKDKISQVLINLISNALKYTPQGGVINITINGNQKLTEISIKDNGIGISQEDLPNIFERFYRADKSRNRLTGGSGIGLTIVKAIVEAHKGSITVFSELNKGTEIIIEFPKH